MAETYELYYWPPLQGRGEYIRLIFEDTDTPYVDVGRQPAEQREGVRTAGAADDHATTRLDRDALELVAAPGHARPREEDRGAVTRDLRDRRLVVDTRRGRARRTRMPPSAGERSLPRWAVTAAMRGSA